MTCPPPLRPSHRHGSSSHTLPPLPHSYSKIFCMPLPDKARRTLQAKGLTFDSALSRSTEVTTGALAAKGRADKQAAAAAATSAAAESDSDADSASDGDVSMEAASKLTPAEVVRQAYKKKQASQQTGDEAAAVPVTRNRARFMPPSEAEMQMKLLWKAEADIVSLIWAPGVAAERILRAPEG